jgi:hypothetical protein
MSSSGSIVDKHLFHYLKVGGSIQATAAGTMKKVVLNEIVHSQQW